MSWVLFSFKVLSFILLQAKLFLCVKATCACLIITGFVKEDGCVFTTEHSKCAPAIETPLSIGCVELAGLDMLSNEMSRGFSVTHFNEAVSPLGEPMNWEASVMDGMNWSIEDGRMQLCDILVLGNYPVKWMNKSAGISSAPSSTEKPPVSKCFARLYPQESSWDNEELVTFRLSLLSLAFCAPASLCRCAGVVCKLQNYYFFYCKNCYSCNFFFFFNTHDL